MLRRQVAFVLIALALIPFTAPFAAYDVDSAIDASASAVWHTPGGTSIDTESFARADAVFPNLHTGCPSLASTPSTGAPLLTPATSARLFSTDAIGRFASPSLTLRI